MSTVHVIAPPAPTHEAVDRRTNAACVLLASHLNSTTHRDPVVCLGPRSSERTLAAFGVEAGTALLPRTGLARTSARRLERVLESATEVHAWGLPAAEAVTRARPRNASIILHADDATTRNTVPNVDEVEVYADADAEAWSASVADAGAVRLVEPKINVALDQRQNIRAALGVHPDATVLTALWDPSGTLDARRFVFRIGFLELLNRPTVVLIPGDARRLAAARRFRAAASLRFRLLITQAPIGALLPACDALAPLDAQPGHPAPASGANAVMQALAEHAGVPTAFPERSPEPTEVSREMAEFMAPLIEHIDDAHAKATTS